MKKFNFPLLSIIIDNKSTDDSNFIKEKVLNIIYEKGLDNLEQSILNDENLKESISNTYLNEIAFKH